MPDRRQTLRSRASAVVSCWVARRRVAGWVAIALAVLTVIMGFAVVGRLIPVLAKHFGLA